MKAGTHAAWLILPGDRIDATGEKVLDVFGHGATVTIRTDTGDKVVDRNEPVAVNGTVTRTAIRGAT